MTFDRAIKAVRRIRELGIAELDERLNLPDEKLIDLLMTIDEKDIRKEIISLLDMGDLEFALLKPMIKSGIRRGYERELAR